MRIHAVHPRRRGITLNRHRHRRLHASLRITRGHTDLRSSSTRAALINHHRRRRHRHIRLTRPRRHPRTTRRTATPRRSREQRVITARERERQLTEPQLRRITEHGRQAAISISRHRTHQLDARRISTRRPSERRLKEQLRQHLTRRRLTKEHRPRELTINQRRGNRHRRSLRRRSTTRRDRGIRCRELCRAAELQTISIRGHLAAKLKPSRQRHRRILQVRRQTTTNSRLIHTHPHRRSRRHTRPTLNHIHIHSRRKRHLITTRHLHGARGLAGDGRHVGRRVRQERVHAVVKDGRAAVRLNAHIGADGRGALRCRLGEVSGQRRMRGGRAPDAQCNGLGIR